MSKATVEAAAGGTGTLVPRVRRLLFRLAVISVLLTFPVLRGAYPTTQGAGAICLAAFIASLSWRHRSGGGLPATVLEVIAVAGYAAFTPEPTTAFGFLFSTIWYRALQGTRRGQLAYWAGLGAALVASIPLWQALHQGEVADSVGFLLGGLPLMLLTTIAAGRLGQELRSREQGQQRDAVVTDLGAALLGVTDRVTILKLGQVATHALCRATPRLHTTTLVTGSAGYFHVLGQDGLPSPQPAIAIRLLPVTSRGTPVPLAPGQLEAVHGFTGRLEGRVMWVPFPGGEGGLLVHGPQSVLPDAIVSAQSVVNQVALALRSSDQHTQLLVRASTDSLTGLANRATFEKALAEQSQRPAHPTGCAMFLDLDDFKHINDAMGHAAGDELLRVVAERLRQATRPADVCARLGGDEFAVLLPTMTPADAAVVAERIVTLLSHPIGLPGGVARIGVSIGVTALGADDIEETMAQADIAMYAAKAWGKNQVTVYDPTSMPAPHRHVTATVTA